jgi:phenylalanine-4-hydroxylase
MAKTPVISEHPSRGLTTGDAPFVEQARLCGELYIDQIYDLYTPANHEAWQRLYERMRPRWHRYANSHFLKGLGTLELPSDRIPKLVDINRILRPMTGFQAKAVSGYVPAFVFFDCLRRREFPTTITIRPGKNWIICPNQTFFMTSQVTCLCTRRRPSPMPWSDSAIAPIRRSK